MSTPDPKRVIAALDGSFALWRAPDSEWRRRLAAELPTYSRAVLERALVDGLASWDTRVLEKIRRDEVPPRSRAPELTAVWLAGSIPATSFAAIALPLLAGSAVYAKTAAADPASAALFAESVGSIDAEVGRTIRVGRSEDALAEADAVVVYGTDETVAALRARVRSDRIFVGYGHKLSVGAVGADVELAQSARTAALDLALYDGRGCLSPAYFLVDETSAGRSRAFAEALAGELGSLATTLPLGQLSHAEQVALRERRAACAMAEQNQVWLSAGGVEWGVWLVPEDARPAPGALRHVPVVPVQGREGLARWCAALAPHLSSLGVVGWGGSEGALTDIALAGGGSRVCALGRMQLPELDWRHDGHGAIEPLFRSGELT